jgi:Flp pilus assembly protein TadD
MKPGWPEAHYNLGLTMIADVENGKLDWNAAIPEFREAVRLRPNYAEAHRALGACFMETGSLDAGIAEFRAALSYANAPETHLDLGKALERASQPGAAELEYREAVRLRPAYAGAEIALGKLLTTDEGNTARLSEAVEHLRRAVKINPDNASAQYGLARALKRLGNTAEASIAFREADMLTARSQEKVRCLRLSNEGLDAAHRGDREAALRSLRQAVELRPDIAIAHYNLGLILADGGDLAAGRQQIVQAISLAQSDARFYVALGRMWKQEGNLARAAAAFRRAAELEPDNKGVPEGQVELPQDPYEYGASADTPEAHFAFATVLAKRSDWIDAAGEWLRVLALRPDGVDARYNLGLSYSRLGKDERAELEFRKALQVSSDSADAHFGLAVLALEHGDKASAARELSEVLRLKRDYPQAQLLWSTISKR